MMVEKLGLHCVNTTMAPRKVKNVTVSRANTNLDFYKNEPTFSFER